MVSSEEGAVKEGAGGREMGGGTRLLAEWQDLSRRAGYLAALSKLDT